MMRTLLILAAIALAFTVYSFYPRTYQILLKSKKETINMTYFGTLDKGEIVPIVFDKDDRCYYMASGKTCPDCEYPEGTLIGAVQ
jgi:hypothetical protein